MNVHVSPTNDSTILASTPAAMPGIRCESAELGAAYDVLAARWTAVDNEGDPEGRYVWIDEQMSGLRGEVCLTTPRSEAGAAVLVMAAGAEIDLLKGNDQLSNRQKVSVERVERALYRLMDYLADGAAVFPAAKYHTMPEVCDPANKSKRVS
jgi:hypothetical protein